MCGSEGSSGWIRGSSEWVRESSDWFKWVVSQAGHLSGWDWLSRWVSVVTWVGKNCLEGWVRIISYCSWSFCCYCTDRIACSGSTLFSLRCSLSSFFCSHAVLFNRSNSLDTPMDIPFAPTSSEFSMPLTCLHLSIEELSRSYAFLLATNTCCFLFADCGNWNTVDESFHWWIRPYTAAWSSNLGFVVCLIGATTHFTMTLVSFDDACSCRYAAMQVASSKASVKIWSLSTQSTNHWQILSVLMTIRCPMLVPLPPKCF